MKILVTGGAGFIGSHLVDKLIDKGHQVLVLDDLSVGKKENINLKAKFIKLNINSNKLGNVIEDFKPKAIYHLVAQKSVGFSFEDPKFDAQINIIGSLNLLQEALRQKINKFIFISSAAVYGNVKKIPTPEKINKKPLSPYGLTKLALEKYLYILADDKLEWTIFRPSNVYGPRQDPEGEAGVISIFINNIMDNLPIVINGDGKQTRDYIYVEDVAEGLLKALNNKGGIFNICTGKETSVNNLVKYLKKINKEKIEVKYRDGIKGEIKYSCLMLDKAKKELNFEPKFNIEKGLKLTYKWFKDKK